jgi:hypothetical protein
MPKIERTETHEERKLESGIKSLGQLFAPEKFYEIPYFQRPFSWDEEHFRELVEDLRDADRAQEYFLGTIVYYTEDGIRKVVDGQQRLTSLMVLLACLGDLIDDKDLKTDIQNVLVSPRNRMMRIDEKSRLLVKDVTIYNQVVVEDGGTNSALDPRDHIDPANRYIRAKDIFRDSLGSLSQQQLCELLDFITHNCVMVFLSAKTFEEAFRLFEIVNDRGKQLRRIDLLKSYNLSERFVKSRPLAERLAQGWEDAETSIGERAFESVIHMMRLIYIRDKPKEDLFREFEKRILGKELPAGEAFFHAVNNFVDLYVSIFDRRNYLDDEKKSNVTFHALMKMMSDEIPTFEWKACVLAYAAKFGRDGFYEFTLGIEKVAVSHLVLAVRKDERYEDYTSILKRIHAAKAPFGRDHGREVQWQKVKDKLSGEDVYGRAYARYVLLRLELSAAELNDIREFTARSIEHVLPQSPDAASKWAAMGTDDERKAEVNKLGNLVLLNQGKNSSAGAQEFEEKKRTYLRGRVSEFPRSLKVCDEPSWSLARIRERTAAAVETLSNDPVL